MASLVQHGGAEQRREACVALAAALRRANPEQGFLFHDALEFAVCDGEVGVRLRAAVPANEILLVVPESALLSSCQLPTGASDEVLRLVLTDVASGFRQHVIGDSPLDKSDVQNIVIVMHTVANADSRWADYRATWPEADALSHLAIFWTDEQLSAAKGTMAAGLVKALHITARRIFDDVLSPALHSRGVAQSFVPNGTSTSDLKVRLWDAFRYACAIQMSRTHNGHEGVAELMPLVDMINGLPDSCRSAHNVCLVAGKWPFIQARDVPPGQFQPGMYRNDCDLPCSAVYALRDMKAGEQLLISYGAISAAAYIFKYGACPPELLEAAVPASPVMMWIPPTIAPDATDGTRVRALRKWDYPSSAAELAERGCWQLEPETLAAYLVHGENDQIKSMRQLLVLSSLADEDACQHNLETGRLRHVSSSEVGRVFHRVVDHNLSVLGATTSAEDVRLAQSPEVASAMVPAILARVVTRESLAQWRHAFSRHFERLSHVDTDAEVPASLASGGCAQCGRTLRLRACTRCKVVRYCCRAHQKQHWKAHKPECSASKK